MRPFSALGQASKANCMGVTTDRKSFFGCRNKIPCHVFLNGEMDESVARDLDCRSSGRSGVVDFDTIVSNAHFSKTPNDFAPGIIISYAGDDVRLRSQGVRMIGEVRRRSSQL